MGYCGGSPISLADPPKPCGYDCSINPKKEMEPFNMTELDPSLLTAPTVTENLDQPLASGSKVNDNYFKFNAGQPGVFLSCANGFDHFPCFQDIFVECNSSNSFTVYSANSSSSSLTIVEKINITDVVKNTHFGCRPCPSGFDYRKGYENSASSKSYWGSHSNVLNIRDCKEICERVNCLSLICSPRSMICKLHSQRLNTTSFPDHQDYQVCIKKEEEEEETVWEMRQSKSKCSKKKKPLKPKPTPVEVFTIPVGQGDSTVIKCPNGEEFWAG